MFPRALNKAEAQGLKEVKQSGLSYELKYDPSPYSGGYVVNIPSLCGTYVLSQIEHFLHDLKTLTPWQENH